ncbi:MAG: hypothetical protein KA765_16070, partial [Thermoflexales bacterium]|nr:hypothetical protein [Thermoflexales bacterium]
MPSSLGAQVGLVIGITVAAIALITAIVVGFVYADTMLMLSTLISVTLAVVQVSLAVYAIYQYATNTLKAVTNMAMVCAVIGLIIGTLVAFGCAIATLVTGHLKFGSAAANLVFAQAIAYAIVAVILFVISLIPVVGQVIVAIISAIDAVISAVCAIASAIVGYDVKGNAVGQWLCKGISGLAAELVRWSIYSSAIMIELQDPDRLQFGKFDYTLVQPEKGLAVGSKLTYQIDLTNTIKLESVIPTTDEMIEGWKSGTKLIPVEWKSMAYAWQFNTNNLKSSTFVYQWQTTDADIHNDLKRDTMTDQWILTGHTNRGGTQDQAYITPTVTSSQLALPEAGINRDPQLFLTEGVAAPMQECVAIPNTLLWGSLCPPPFVLPFVCWTPICYVRTDRSTNNFDFGERFLLDVFPATLDDFYTPVGKDGGVSLAWGQAADAPMFARQLDFDGDTLINQAAGGGDPNDALWDTDGDSLSDSYEFQHGTSPTLLDSDADGLSDPEELRLGTDPNRKDTDGDGLTDQEEIIGWQYVYAIASSGAQLRTWVVSDPLAADQDWDTLSDFKERTFGFNPKVMSDPQVLAMQTGVHEVGAPQLLLRLDEAAGATTFTDASGNGHTALCSDSANTCPVSGQGGRYDRAPVFSSDVLRVAHSPLNERVTDYTIGAWVYPTAQFGLTQAIVSTARTNSDNGFSFGLSGRSLYLNLYGVNTFTANTNIQLNRWTYVAVTVSPAEVNFFADGTRYFSAGSSTRNLRLNPDRDDVLLIGAGTSAGSATLTDTFNGGLDDVAIYARALTANEVQAASLGQFNPDDGYLMPGASVQYTSTLGNKLMDRYAQGLWSIGSLPAAVLGPVIAPQTIVLPPLAQTALTGTLMVDSAAASGVISLTQAAQAAITNWREQADYAQLWLKLNEPLTATTFTDYSGQTTPANGSCATNTCPTRQATGYFDYGLAFAGSQFVTLSNTQRLGLYDSSFSASLWVKPTDTSSTRTLLAIDRAAGTNALRLELSSGKPAFIMHSTTLTGTPTLRLNNWYHLVFRYDKAAGEQAIYLNGELIASRLNAQPISGTATTAAVLGRAFNNSNFYKGNLDDVRLYARALDLAEIRTLYNQPVLHLEFESLANSLMNLDSSGFANQVECSGTTCPSAAPGISGQGAANFDGADYFAVRPQPSLNLSDGQFTLAAWVKPIAQGEPVSAACNMTTYFNPPSGYPITTGCANWTVPSIDTDNSISGTYLINYQATPNQWPSGFGGRWTGQFEFAPGKYTFYGDFGASDTVMLSIDNVEIATSVTAGRWWQPNGKVFTINTAGLHTVSVEVRTYSTTPYARFGWMPPHVQSIVGYAAGNPDAYPTLQNVGRRVRFGFGTIDTVTNHPLWVSNTTTETVLLANKWNHLVLTFGPRYKT